MEPTYTPEISSQLETPRISATFEMNQNSAGAWRLGLKVNVLLNTTMYDGPTLYKDLAASTNDFKENPDDEQYQEWIATKIPFEGGGLSVKTIKTVYDEALAKAIDAMSEAIHYAQETGVMVEQTK